jgi:hypothetical protein
MRTRTIVTGTLLALALAGSGSAVQALSEAVTGPSATTVSLQQQAAHSAMAAQPAEDSPRFDCRKHGNRQCGVTLDPKPSDGKRQAVRYVITFNKAGQPVAVKPLGR